MKKFIFVLLSCVMALTMTLNCFALEIPAAAVQRVLVSSETEYLEDGSYIITEIYEDVPTGGTAPYAATQTKSGSKIQRHTTADNVLLWSFTLTASFTYSSSSVTCNSTDYSYNIVNDRWSVENPGSFKDSKQIAHGKATFIKKFLSFLTNEVKVDLTLSCNTNGNLS